LRQPITALHGIQTLRFGRQTIDRQRLTVLTAARGQDTLARARCSVSKLVGIAPLTGPTHPQFNPEYLAMRTS